MAADKVEEELKVIKDDLQKLRGDLSDLVGLFKELGLEKAGAARSALEDEVQEQRDRLEAGFDRARVRGKRSMEDLEQRLDEHPLGVLAAAFGLGYILARLSGGNP
ncbi:MAG TPA: hypothetical protein VF982_09650 [Anaerolineales bacterium]